MKNNLSNSYARSWTCLHGINLQKRIACVCLFIGESGAPTVADPIAMMEYYVKKAAHEERRRQPKQSKDEMPPPPSLQGLY